MYAKIRNGSIPHYFLDKVREAAKKKTSLNGLSILREKKCRTFFSNVPMFQRPLSLRGGGGLGLNGPVIKRITFFAASLNV